MQLTTIEQWRAWRSEKGRACVGFVPTMGSLHQGHASLIKRSVLENDITVVSVFVNPTQFNEKNDYEAYPKSLEEDTSLVQSLGADIVFCPEAETMYPEQNTITMAVTHALAQCMEGKYRPGHFEGMLAIVMKLLIGIQPDKAYFGEKDFQQLALVKSMANQFFLPTEIIGCPTIEERSGLPLSSRNKRLNADARARAEQFFQAFRTSTVSDLEALRALASHLNIQLEYLESHDERLFVAFRINDVRLIHNRLL